MEWTAVYSKSKTHPIEDDYEVGEQLGSGTYSVVHKGKNLKTGELVALKIMNKSSDPEELEALTDEIGIMEKIKEADHVVRLQEVYETQEHILLVLDLVTGGELFERIVARGSYSEQDAAYALRQMMTALSQIHSKRIVHRDLKPENILCTHRSLEGTEDIKIADFGESIQLAPGEYTTDLRGSPCYIAPEVWLQEDYDMAADMWSMGVIAFILLGGYLPFQEPPQENEDDEKDELRISEVIIRGEYHFHPEVWGDTSESAKDFVSKLLNVNHKKRMTAAEALVHPFLVTADSASTLPRDKAIANLKSFNAKRKWQSLAQMVIATNKLKMLSGMTQKHRHSSTKVKKQSTRKKQTTPNHVAEVKKSHSTKRHESVKSMKSPKKT